MGLNNALLITQVSHARARPKQNRFRYHVYYICFALKDWSLLSRLRLLSLAHFNLFSLRARDYGRGQGPESWIRGLLAEHGITQANGEIVLMTMPRVLGYAFNPVSFWFCLDQEGALRAVLADVTNTFGERHGYLLHHDDQRPITKDDWMSSKKVFHVSPFIEITGHYQFRFAYSEERIGAWIDHYDEAGKLLATSVVGDRTPLTSASLFYSFLRYPLVTFKVISLIHYQALRLFTKGVRYHVKPTPPEMEITR